MQMADLCAAQPMGREALGHALRRLARQVRRNVVGDQALGASPKPSRSRTATNEDLLALDAAAVAAFLEDQNKTKDELLELAAVRFSMPRSQLRRDRIEVLRQSIRSALMHESSIDIIGVEATKGGINRRS